MYHTHNIFYPKPKRVDLQRFSYLSVVEIPHTWDSKVSLILTRQNGVIVVLPWPTCISLMVDAH